MDRLTSTVVVPERMSSLFSGGFALERIVRGLRGGPRTPGALMVDAFYAPGTSVAGPAG
jgi:hypothetical protein